MSNCIYYKDQPDLTFNKGEHVIPAGIGGQRKLPKGYVSDQFNHDISKIEMAFMRNSIIAMPRQLVGPGKRGKTTQKATRSPVMVITQPGPPETHALGYLSLAKAIHLPQIKMNTASGELNWSVPIEMAASPDDYLRGELQRCSAYKARHIPDKKLSEEEVIIGFDEQLYIARHPARDFELTTAIIDGIKDAITNSAGPYRPLHQPVSFNQVSVIADDFYRVTAKIALNTLALLKGKIFVLGPAFDVLRAYITDAGTNPGVIFIPKPKLMPQFPADAHHLMFAASKGKLAANVCFYNQFTVNVVLANNFDEDFQPLVYLCDWRNKQEGTV
ncbi:hypothetical protein [Mucilaginibacter flavidus]|uniref:hypothetical protein n=1 Tax=Mucilaginibacter flavidus TaxID=2949309 RepID=UPI002093D251|nr:hypothetical protein [Mucilaginibacter flavidus]MCO5948564.1 hypothetical protein [Mucilaginibacter flavidus]